MAFYGRKINSAEHQLAFIEMLRLITDGTITPEEAVRAYHSVLEHCGLKPKLPLEQDSVLTDQAVSYGGGSRSTVTVPAMPDAAGAEKKPSAVAAPAASAAAGASSPASAPAASAPPSPDASASPLWPKKADGFPDLGKMTSAQRLSYDLSRLSKKYG